MVARQLIAAFYPDMEYDAMSAVTGVGEHKFLSRGRAVIAQGWQAANPPLRSKPKKGEEEQALPQLQKGQRVPVKSAKAVAKKTTPPRPIPKTRCWPRWKTRASSSKTRSCAGR